MIVGQASAAGAARRGRSQNGLIRAQGNNCTQTPTRTPGSLIPWNYENALRSGVAKFRIIYFHQFLPSISIDWKMGRKRAPLRKTEKNEQSSEQPLKVRRLKENLDSDEESDDDDEEEEEEEEEERQNSGESEDDQEFSFSFSDPSAQFLEGLVLLFKQRWKSPYAFELASLVVNQEEVGTVVHCDGETDVFAFATVLPFSKLQANQEIRPIYKELKELVGEASSSLATEKVGLMLHGRFHNLPPPLLPELYRQLNEDLKWIMGSAEDDSFKTLSHFVLLCPLADAQSALQKLGKRSLAELASFADVGGLAFVEDQQLSREAQVKAVVKVDSKLHHSADAEGQVAMGLLLVRKEKFAKMVWRVEDFLEDFLEEASESVDES
eukprot:gene10469-11599_t